MKPYVLHLAITLSLITLLNASNHSAQVRRRDPVGGAANAESRRQSLMTGPVKSHKSATAVSGVPYQKINDDFEQLQLIDRRLLDQAASSVLDYVQVRKDVAEVKKRASQLKKNLLLTEQTETLKVQTKAATAEELKVMIFALNDLVERFVGNSVFQQPGIVDAQGWEQARKDLDGIIMLSYQIQGNVLSMSKAAARNRK